MKKQLISTSGSILRFHGPPVTPTKQNQQQQRDATTSSTSAIVGDQQLQQRHTAPPPIPLSPRLKLHVRNGSNLVHMLVSPTLSSRSSLSSMGSNYSSPYGTPRSATSSNSSNNSNNSSAYTSPTGSSYSPKISSPSSPSRFSSHSRTLSLPSSPMLSRRSWTNRLSLSFQSLSSRRSYNPANSPLFDVLEIPEDNDYAAFESWERSLRLYLGSQELEGIVDTDMLTNPASTNRNGTASAFTDTQRLKAKKVIQTHVCDKLKMDIQLYDTPAEIFAFLRKTCLPIEGQALGDTMVKLVTTKLSFDPTINININTNPISTTTNGQQQQQQQQSPPQLVRGWGTRTPPPSRQGISPPPPPPPAGARETDDLETVKRFNRAFRGRLWALGQVGSTMPDQAAASMYLGAVEKAFEAWRMGMLWMDLSLGMVKLDSLMAMFEDGKNVVAWKKKRGTAAGLLCWAENMGKGWDSPSPEKQGGRGRDGMGLDVIPETGGLGMA